MVSVIATDVTIPQLVADFHLHLGVVLMPYLNILSFIIVLSRSASPCARYILQPFFIFLHDKIKNYQHLH